MKRVLLSLLLSAAVATAATATAQRPGSKPRVIVCGWDGADWSLLDPLIAEGKLPNLAALVASGRTYDLASFQPMASPMIWTTIATGRTPIDHGVADFQETDPKTRTRLPISGRSRAVPALWNVASAKGVTVGVVNWWATWPAERVNGFLVSDRAAPVLFDPEALAKAPALAWPEGLADGVRLVQRREGNPPYEEVAKGLSISRAEFDRAVAAGKDLADPVTGYRKILGTTRVAARIALDLYDREKPELLMVYFQGTDEAGHVLGRYFPPRLPSISEADFRKYSGAIEATYVEHDRILGELAKRAARDGASLVLVSDHGFRWDETRPVKASGTGFDTAFLWHQSPGVMIAAGPGFVPSKARGKASVFDVAPTLARLLGLPPDPRFEGKPVDGLDAKALPAPAKAAAWGPLAKVERLVVPETTAEERKAAEEFTKKLVSLGYLTGSEASAVDARPSDRKGTETAGHFANLGTFLRERGDAKGAIPWYRKALEVNPKSASAAMNLSQALLTTGALDEADETLVRALQNGYNDPDGAAMRRADWYEGLAEKQPSARVQMKKYATRLVAAFPAKDRYRVLLGRALFASEDCPGAEAALDPVVARNAKDVEALNLLGLAAMCQGNVAKAKGLFQRSLAVEPHQPAIREGLSRLQ